MARCTANLGHRVCSKTADERWWFVDRVRLLFTAWSILAWVAFWVLFPAVAWPQQSSDTSTAPASEGAALATSSGSETVVDGGLDLRSLEVQLKKTLEKVMPSVVAISGGGSGVVVSEDGYVLTVAHVGMQAGRRVRVTFPDGRQAMGTTLGNDAGVDAGLIKLNQKGPYPYAPMGASAGVEPGRWCVALGYPLSFDRGKNPAVRIGRVLGNNSDTLVTDCTIMGGDSGGPLFDLDGNVIGVSSRCDTRLTVNIHVPVDCYLDTWERLTAGEDFNSLSRNIAYLGVGPQQGVEEPRIGQVFPDTGAARAGLQVGDVLVKFDGEELSRYSDLPPLIQRRKPGDEVEIVVRRGEQILTLKARLSDRDE
jgi:serine protease Do